MQLQPLGKSGLWVSELGLGSLTFGGQTSAWDARQIMDQFVQQGGNWIDTANGFNQGRAEEIIGQWMADGKHRPHILISSKTFFPEDGDVNHRRLSRHAILFSVEKSLKRLQTDYLDIYAPHYWDAYTPLEETLRAFESLVQSGKVRYIACSNWLGWQVMKALGLQTGKSPFIALHAQYSLVERGIERDILPLCHSEGLGLLAWSPLAGGFLTGKFSYGTPLDENTRLGKEDSTLSRLYRNVSLHPRGWAILDSVKDLAQAYGVSPTWVALRWVMQASGVTSTLLGISQIEQIDHNLEVVNFRLAVEDWAHLNEMSALEPAYPASMVGWLTELLE